MSLEFDGPISLEIGSSRFLTALFAAMHLGAMALVVLLPLAPVWRLLLECVILASWYHVFVNQALRGRALSVVAVSWEGKRGWAVRYRKDTEETACQVTSRFIHPRITVLTLRCQGRWLPLKLAIAFDAVDREAFRRWRVRLRLQTAAE